MKAVTTDDWYFDSGCLRHMTREMSYLCDYQNMSDGYISFGDGREGHVLGKGTLFVNGLSKLKSVLHVEGLKANLLSISQLCDQKLNVKFTRDNCKVLNRSGEVVLEGSRSSDNYYKLIHSHTCYTTSLENIDL